MRQFHARAHFHRVELADNRRKQIRTDYRKRWIFGDEMREVDETPRFRRLCRISAMYRMAGYLYPQEL